MNSKGLSDVTVENEIIQMLISNPSLVLEPDFMMSPDDFVNRRNKLVYAAIVNLATQGVQPSAATILDYLHGIGTVEKELQELKGFELLTETIKLPATKQEFNIIYSRLKKYSLMRELENAGFSTKDLYSQTLLDDSDDLLRDEFEDTSIQEFIDRFKSKLNDIEEKFKNKNEERGISVAEGLNDLIEEYKITPAIGIPLDGQFYNYAVRGARLGKMYLTSSPSSHGKTRRMIGQACALSLPYLTKDNKIVMKEQYYPALFISTEQSVKEIQTLVLAYVSNVNEDKITDGLVNCNEDELKRIEIAIKIIELFKDYLLLEQISDPSIGLLKTKAIQYIYKKNVRYIFFDYIFTSPSLLSEFAAARLREDVVLLMLSNALKEIATTYDVFVMSGTQISGNYAPPCFRDVTFLRGSKAIADKIDIGDITVRLLPEEEAEISSLKEVSGLRPNIVKDIYKNRSGELTQIKIFSRFDFATCHIEDYYMTDLSYQPIDPQNINFFVQKTQYLENLEELEKAKNRMEEEVIEDEQD